MEQSFESAMARLEEISAALMQAAPLLQSLEYYKEAAELISYCDKTLKEAELVVEEYHKSISDVTEREPAE